MSAPSLSGAIPVYDFHFVSCAAQPLADIFGNHHRAVLTPGTTETDGEVALALMNVVGQQVDQQVGDAADELLGLRK